MRLLATAFEEPEFRLSRAIALVGYHVWRNKVARRSNAKTWRSKHPRPSIRDRAACGDEGKNLSDATPSDHDGTKAERDQNECRGFGDAPHERDVRADRVVGGIAVRSSAPVRERSGGGVEAENDRA